MPPPPLPFVLPVLLPPFPRLPSSGERVLPALLPPGRSRRHPPWLFGRELAAGRSAASIISMSSLPSSAMPPDATTTLMLALVHSRRRHTYTGFICAPSHDGRRMVRRLPAVRPLLMG